MEELEQVVALFDFVLRAAAADAVLASGTSAQQIALVHVGQLTPTLTVMLPITAVLQALDVTSRKRRVPRVLVQQAVERQFQPGIDTVRHLVVLVS